MNLPKSLSHFRRALIQDLFVAIDPSEVQAENWCGSIGFQIT